MGAKLSPSDGSGVPSHCWRGLVHAAHAAHACGRHGSCNLAVSCGLSSPSAAEMPGSRAVFEATLQTAWRYARLGAVNGGKRATRALVLGDVVAIARHGYIKGGSRCDDYMSGLRGFSVMNEFGRRFVLSHMEVDGITVIRLEDGIVWNNHFFSRSFLKDGPYAADILKASAAWLSEQAQCYVLLIPSDSTGEVWAFRPGLGHTEERPAPPRGDKFSSEVLDLMSTHRKQRTSVPSCRVSSRHIPGVTGRERMVPGIR
eukprot:NODE_17257_length_953_cov_3.537530.p1 GENE.NODE_17257_length_953_cov_3.537530~~NODE_17257_length_953_cov_3.537530.p1  ORF type:complete len:258 (-),score=37.09 NODE_17257_length_953_cov_3.537530:92-865(-)